MNIKISTNENTTSRKGKYQKQVKIFYAEINFQKADWCCVRPRMYLVYWKGSDEFVVSLGDYDDLDYFRHIKFSKEKVHEILNIMKDYEMSYITYKEGCDLIDMIWKCI